VEDLKRVEARDLSEEARAALREIVAETLHAFDHEGLDAAHRCILKHMSSAWLTELMSDEGGSTIIDQHRVFRLACRLTSETDAPDVVQETFLQRRTEQRECCHGQLANAVANPLLHRSPDTRPRRSRLRRQL
jgi:hypothetical protein